MKPYTVVFLSQTKNYEMHPVPEAFKFAPKGRMQYFQKLAWKFLKLQKALEQSYEQKETILSHVIDADRFVDLIFKQKRSLFDGFNKEAKRLIIGSEDYFDLINEPTIYKQFNFMAEIMSGDKIFGLEVEVVPWMRGAIVMP